MTNAGEKIRTVPDVVREVLNERATAAAEFFGKAVRPIYRVKNGRPDHLGTGIFLKRGGKHLLMTAAHVVDHADSYDLQVAVGTKLFSLTDLEGAMTTLTKEGRETDRYDFAVLWLPTDTVEALGPVKYIEEHEIAEGSIDPIGRGYMAFGFPNTRNDPKINHDNRTLSSEALSYAATVTRNEALAKTLGISGEEHFFISYKKRSRLPDGSIVNSIKPKGMSGGALIDIGRIDVASLEAQQQRFALAGLLIEHQNEKGPVVVAVRIPVIFSALERPSSAWIADECSTTKT